MAVKRYSPVAQVAALLIGLVALPVCAQHSGFHGGGSGHASSVSRGGPARFAPGRFSAYRGAPLARTPGARVPGMERGSHRGFPGNPGPRPPYTGDWHHRRPYVSPYGAGYYYGIPGYGWVSPYFLGNPDYGYDDASNQPAAPAEGDAGEPEDQDQVRQQANPLPPYQPNPDFSRPAPAPVEEEAVTLIFKDGRPSEQIHNYLLTATTLFVVDQHQRAIPTDQLDLVATARVNQDAGVDFQLPNSVK